jgi:F-type H+-transporting ATPase subunit b
MLIDWFTTLAQVVNFLILVWLLQRFLYKPILAAMDAREQRIATQIQDAEKQKKEAEAQSAKFREAHSELEQHREDMLRQAESEAEALRQRLKEEARQEIESVRKKWQEAFRDEQDTFRAKVARGVELEVFLTTRKVLADLAGAELEQQIIEAFVRRLGKLGQEDKKSISVMLFNGEPAVIRSGFELSSPARESVEAAVVRLEPAGAQANVRYEVAPELLGGIELAAGGRKVSWSIGDYLSSLEQRVQELVAQKARRNGNDK